MKPLKNRFIVKFDSEQKEYFQYGTLKLYSPQRGLRNEDAKVAYPTVAEVVEPNGSGFNVGDLAVFPHTILDNKSKYIKKEGSIVYMTIPFDGSEPIFGKIGSKGEIIPMFNNYVCKRMEEAKQSNIIITPDSYKKNNPYKGIVLASPPNSDILEGTTVIWYKHSDYKLHYNVNGEERETIVVKREDIVAVCKN